MMNSQNNQKRERAEEVEDTNEVLDIAQRRDILGRRMKRMKAKIVWVENVLPEKSPV